MPYKNLSQRRKYFRELMRKRRSQVKTGITVKPCASCLKLKTSPVKVPSQLFPLASEIIKKNLSPNYLTYELYVDYALYGSVGVVCEQLTIKKSMAPKEVIQWQIEGEALAIKYGVEQFLTHLPAHIDKSEIRLLLYTDNSTLLREFTSRTQAGQWRKEALSLLTKEKIAFELKFIAGKDNPADSLTRTTQRVVELSQRNKNYYYQKWLKVQPLIKRKKIN